jgi:hypothetical protein
MHTVLKIILKMVPCTKNLFCKQIEIMHVYAVFVIQFWLDYVLSAPSATNQITLCTRMLGLNPGLQQLWHWQLHTLITRLDLIHYTFPSFCLHIYLQCKICQFFLCMFFLSFAIVTIIYVVEMLHNCKKNILVLFTHWWVKLGS